MTIGTNHNCPYMGRKKPKGRHDHHHHNLHLLSKLNKLEIRTWTTKSRPKELTKCEWGQKNSWQLSPPITFCSPKPNRP
jgi:hypothetical protein